MISGIVAIELLKYIARRGKFGGFAYYCWAAGALTIISDYLPTQNVYGLSAIGVYTYSSGTRIGARFSAEMLADYGEVTDAASGLTAIKAYLQDHPLTLVWTLATPVTYQLDPVPVDLSGVVNVWADCGDVTMTSDPLSGTLRLDWQEGAL